MSNDLARRIAQPGDDDLDLDIDGVTITSVIVDGRELLVGVTGGFGTWISTDGERATFDPGDPDAHVCYGEFHLGYPEMPDEAWDFYVAQLEKWRDAATPLRVCAAPGRPSTLIEDRSTWLPMARNPFPTD